MTKEPTAEMRRRRRWTRWGLGGLFVLAGVLHFVAPDFYLQIMPPYLPWPRALVYVSGAAEIAGGVGVLLAPLMRRWAAIGLVLLLVAVFPANVHMTHEAIAARGWTALYTWATLARLPLQFVLVALVWWSSAGRAPERGSASAGAS